MSAAPEASRLCASCGATVAGRYCGQCGERVLEPHMLTVRHFFLHSVVAQLTDLDGKIWKTLRMLLFQPAALALEYAAGRRRGFIHPVRVLVTAVVIYAISTVGGLHITFNVGAITLNMAPVPIQADRSIDSLLFQVDRFDVLRHLIEAKLGTPAGAMSAAMRARFAGSLAAFATPLSFTVVLLFALAQYVLFRHRRPLFVEHLVFSFHYFSFVLLWSLLAVPPIKLGLLNTGAIIALLLGISLWQLAYLCIAIRRFYLLRPTRWFTWPVAGGVALTLYLLNAVFMTGVQLLGGVIAVWRL